MFVHYFQFQYASLLKMTYGDIDSSFQALWFEFIHHSEHLLIFTCQSYIIIDGKTVKRVDCFEKCPM